MGSKPSKVKEVTIDSEATKQSPKEQSEEAPNKDSKTTQDVEKNEEDENEEQVVETNDGMNEEVQQQLEKSKEIASRHLEIMKAENEKETWDTYCDVVHKSSKVVAGLYFKLKKQKISQRRMYRRAISNHIIDTNGTIVLVETIRKTFNHGWRDAQGSIIKEVYNVYYSTIQILWNFTDSSDTLAKSLGDEGMISLIVEIINKEYQNAMSYAIDLSARRIIKSCLAVTANCSFHELSRDIVKQSTMLDTLEKLSNAGFEELEIYFVLIPAYIATEEQSEKMFHDQSIINMVVRHLEKATNERTRRSRGFSVHELIVLVGQLAVKDANKLSLAKAGAIPILIKVASGTRKMEQAAAVNALEHLSFHDDNKPAVRVAQDLFEELLKSDNRKTRKAAEGIIWNLKTKEKKTESSSKDNKDPHVMISYQWSSQPWMIKIKDKLKAAGFKVWLDIESMEGSTLAGMADAVENAAVVLVGISQKYKESANCRMEAEYAFQLKRDIIPLMMEDNYRPDGWLGMLIGAKLYYKFTESTDFSGLSDKLIKDLGERGKTEAVMEESEMTTKFDNILGDIDIHTKGKILVKQRKYEENVDKLRLAVEKGDLNSEETTRPALFAIATMFPQMNTAAKETKLKYKMVLLRTFLDGKGHESTLAVMKFCVDHGWRNADDDSVDDSYWKPFNTSMTTWWNFTDLSGEACETALNGGILQILRQVMEKMEGPRFLKDEASADKIAARAVRASLACIYNCCIHPDSRARIREANVVDEFLGPFLNIKSEVPRTYIIFIMAYTLNEEQSERFFADEGLISYIVGRLSKAAANDKHRDGGYGALELTNGVKRLAVNDSNKVQIVKSGGLVPLQSLMKDGDTDEKIAATETLWVLAFHDENKKEILACTELMDELEKLKMEEDARLKKACEGVLWVLQEKSTKQVKTVSTTGAGDPTDQTQGGQHIMISYQWNSQPLMIKIKDRLKAEGFSVWMDVEHMGGSTLAAMADAVENAAAIVTCMTQDYKDSPNCRTEAEYAFQLHKTIVPIKTRAGYRPDGWLGMLLGAKFYFEFLNDDSFESAMQALIKELGQRAMRITSARKKRRKSAKKESEVKAVSVSDVSSAQSQMAAGTLHWKKEDVEKWINDNGLDKSKLGKLTGEQLVYLKSLRREAPEFFYHYLETYFKVVDLTQLMKLTRSLDKLY